MLKEQAKLTKEGIWKIKAGEENIEEWKIKDDGEDEEVVPKSKGKSVWFNSGRDES